MLNTNVDARCDKLATVVGRTKLKILVTWRIFLTYKVSDMIILAVGHVAPFNFVKIPRRTGGREPLRQKHRSIRSAGSAESRLVTDGQSDTKQRC